MKIIDMEQKHQQTYFHCLEEWSDEMKEAGSHKENWYQKMKDKGLRVKFAEDDKSQIVGMIQYMPAELSFVQGGHGYYFIKCIWVHGHKEGVGDNQKQGIGSLLLSAAEKDCQRLGLNGLLAWGIAMPFWMRASWYKKHGYKKIDKDGVAVLLLKTFGDKENSIESSIENSVENPTDDIKLIRLVKKPPVGTEKVNVTVFLNGWCPANNITTERTLRAVKDFEDKIDVNIIDTTKRENYEEWGIYDGVYIDGHVVQMGPPKSYEAVHKMIEKRVKKLD